MGTIVVRAVGLVFIILALSGLLDVLHFQYFGIDHVMEEVAESREEIFGKDDPDRETVEIDPNNIEWIDQESMVYTDSSISIPWIGTVFLLLNGIIFLAFSRPIGRLLAKNV